jgi:hypothetical protein
MAPSGPQSTTSSSVTSSAPFRSSFYSSSESTTPPLKASEPHHVLRKPPSIIQNISGMDSFSGLPGYNSPSGGIPGSGAGLSGGNYLTQTGELGKFPSSQYPFMPPGGAEKAGSEGSSWDMEVNFNLSFCLFRKNGINII